MKSPTAHASRMTAKGAQMACLNPCGFWGTYVFSMRTPVLTTLDCATRSYRPTIRELPHQWMQVRLLERFDGASSGSRSPLGNHFRVLQVKTGGFLVGTREG